MKQNGLTWPKKKDGGNKEKCQEDNKPSYITKKIIPKQTQKVST